jgi:pimeloyl-ACP methyl ester carboxylesterase
VLRLRRPQAPRGFRVPGYPWVPALFIAGTDDPTLMFMSRARAAEVVTGPYREVMIDGAGHWLQQERPDKVNEVLLDFLSSLRSGLELP